MMRTKNSTMALLYSHQSVPTSFVWGLFSFHLTQSGSYFNHRVSLDKESIMNLNKISVKVIICKVCLYLLLVYTPVGPWPRRLLPHVEYLWVKGVQCSQKCSLVKCESHCRFLWKSALCFSDIYRDSRASGFKNKTS